MAEVYDILMKIGITEAVMNTLGSIHGNLERVAKQAKIAEKDIVSLTDKFAMLALRGSTFVIGAAVTIAAGFDKIAEHAGGVSKELVNMRLKGMEAQEALETITKAKGISAAVGTVGTKEVLSLQNELMALFGQKRGEALAGPMARFVPFIGQEGVMAALRLARTQGIEDPTKQEAFVEQLTKINEAYGKRVPPQAVEQTFLKMREQGHAMSPDMLPIIAGLINELGASRMGPGAGLHAGAQHMRQLLDKIVEARRTAIEKGEDPDAVLPKSPWKGMGITNKDFLDFGTDPNKFLEKFAPRILSRAGVTPSGKDFTQEEMGRITNQMERLFGAQSEPYLRMLLESPTMGRLTGHPGDSIQEQRARALAKAAGQEDREAIFKESPEGVHVQAMTALGGISESIGKELEEIKSHFEKKMLLGVLVPFRQWLDSLPEGESKFTAMKNAAMGGIHDYFQGIFDEMDTFVTGKDAMTKWQGLFTSIDATMAAGLASARDTWNSSWAGLQAQFESLDVMIVNAFHTIIEHIKNVIPNTLRDWLGPAPTPLGGMPLAPGQTGITTNLPDWLKNWLGVEPATTMGPMIAPQGGTGAMSASPANRSLLEALSGMSRPGAGIGPPTGVLDSPGALQRLLPQAPARGGGGFRGLPGIGDMPGGLPMSMNQDRGAIGNAIQMLAQQAGASRGDGGAAPVVISLNIDGRRISEALSTTLAQLMEHPGQAPYHDSFAGYAPPDQQFTG